MELSEHEARILQELEDDLSADDPRLARALGRAERLRLPVHRSILAAATIGLGIALMAYALALRSIPLGVVAFAVTTAGAYATSLPFTWFRRHRRRTPKHDDSRQTPER
ncbi:DUF3040 domain-containing protein [Specibacter sp. RAF43]|uniref:DUF3040 domain-containing protein n=1 Tax=Specibacter sp. RAF43 TaxID=3233057 RepID=UPI003F95668F